MSTARNLDDIQGALESIDAKIEQVNAIYQSGQLTDHDIERATELSNQIARAQWDLQSLQYSYFDASGQTRPAPIRVALHPYQPQTVGTITGNPTGVRNRPTLPANTLGSFGGPQTGQLILVVNYYLNGNYGTLTFKGTVDSRATDAYVITITGECKQDAQKRLDAILARLDYVNQLIVRISAGVVSMATGATAVIAAGIAGIAISVSLGALIAFVAVLAGIAVYMYLTNKTNEAKAYLKSVNQPFIDNLPDCAGQ